MPWRLSSMRFLVVNVKMMTGYLLSFPFLSCAYFLFSSFARRGPVLSRGLKSMLGIAASSG